MAENNQKQSKKPLTEDDIQEEPVSSNQNKTVKIVLIVVGVLVLLGIIGALLFGWIATRVGTSIFEQATNGSVEIDDDGIRFGNEDGEFEVSGGDRELSQDFPTEVPIYEPAELTSSSRMRQGGETVWSATYKTTDSQRDVNDFYETVLEQNGWETEASFQSDNLNNISASNESAQLQLQVSILFDGSDNTTGITLTVINTEEEN